MTLELMLWVNGFLILPGLVGLLTFFYWVKKPEAPADTSNRINRIKTWWIGLTHPEELAKLYRCSNPAQTPNTGTKDVNKTVRLAYPWLRGDVLDQ